MADSFVPVTFVADELLTSTKMNLLAANQAGFHDGTALGDGIIVTRHLGSAAYLKLPAGNIDFSSFVNHYSNIITINTSTPGNFSGTSTRSSQSVSIPAGCSRALVIASVRLQSQVPAANDMTSRVQVGSGNATGTGVVTGLGTFNASMSTMIGIVNVTTGMNTFDLVCTAGSSSSVSNYTCLVIPLPD